MRRLPLLCLLLASTAWTACKKSSPPAPGDPGAQPSHEQSASPAGNSGSRITTIKRPPPPAEIWKEFSGDKAFAEVRKQVDLGPRPSGSPESEKMRALLEESLHRSGWEVERQSFTEKTPRGPQQFINLIARFPAVAGKPAPRDTQKAIVAAHYDTKRFSTIRFVGANDAASGAGGLLELARVLALDPALASKVEIALFDGGEPLVQFSDTDGAYGSRSYASQLASGKRASQFKYALVWDMIGDRELKITLPPDAPADLARDFLAGAEALQCRGNFGFFERGVHGDHEPLIHTARIPTLDITDLEYPSMHTADDTVDRIAPESLQTVGAVTLHYLRKTLPQ